MSYLLVKTAIQAMAVYLDEDPGGIVEHLPSEISITLQGTKTEHFGWCGTPVGLHHLRQSGNSCASLYIRRQICKVVGEPSLFGGRSIDRNHFFHFVRFLSDVD